LTVAPDISNAHDSPNIGNYSSNNTAAHLREPAGSATDF